MGKDLIKVVNIMILVVNFIFNLFEKIIKFVKLMVIISNIIKLNNIIMIVNLITNNELLVFHNNTFIHNLIVIVFVVTKLVNFETYEINQKQA